MASLSERLKELRKTKGITQKQLAEKTGISYSSVIDYENNKREPNAKAMVALERYFGVSGEYLRGEVDRDTYLLKSAQVDDDLGELIEIWSTMQADFRIADRDVQLEAVGYLKAAVAYASGQLLKPEEQRTLTWGEKVAQLFAELTRPEARAASSYLLSMTSGEPLVGEDELKTKYRQLDARGQAAVLDNLRREYDYLFRPVEVPYAAKGGGKQVAVTTQAEEAELAQRLDATKPPENL